MHVGGTHAYGIKLMLQRELRPAQPWFLKCSVLPSEALFDAAVRELFEETSLTRTVDSLTLLSGNHVLVPLLDGKYHLVYLFQRPFSFGT
jgi:hypothetical protein